ncbi:carbohydrate sulfotransferase 11-like [Mya arenaria]|uniref:carbohydrate sulfotransferase 11-like n=1 Tax=Mya arenaria TaxID=6604 RepID=UPI0022E26535|nr:carbohydrate sulfotransferase 11-like [Mya arenaria]
MVQRKNRVTKVCSSLGKVTNAAKELSGIRDANLSYCAVQKAGCTMWIRLFKFLQGQKRYTNDPMSLTKYEIHNEASQFYKRFDLEADREFMKSSYRVMTVRDPYTRIWSAYVDKFVLPDFWYTKGKHIISLLRLNADAKSLRCGHDVTFREFIDYVIKVGHQFTFLNQDKHWLPASDICDPCFFYPDAIGKQETFMSDFEYVLKHKGLEKWIDKIKSVDATEFEINEEIDYNFKLLHHRNKCLDRTELAMRLWTAFVINGYIPANESLPRNLTSETISQETFARSIHAVRSKYNISSEEKRAVRIRAVTAAFQQLTELQMDSLAKLYRWDFELFGYNPKPDYLAANN